MTAHREENTYLAQVAKVCKLPSEAALIGNLGAFGAERDKRIDSNSKIARGTHNNICPIRRVKDLSPADIKILDQIMW